MSDQVTIQTPRHRPHWAVELAWFLLVARSGKQSALNILELSLFSFMLGLHFGVGEWGTAGCLNVIRNCCKWYRTLCEQTQPLCSGFLYSHAPKIKNKISSEGQKHIFPLGNEIIWKIIMKNSYCVMLI